MAFTETSPLSANSELLRRMYSPLAAAQMNRELAETKSRLLEQSIDPTQERFLVHVPPEAPPHGYGILVFVPPWRNARLPQGWADVLDRFGLIFVSAMRSGNDARVIERREPLALIAAYNIAQRYPVNPERIFIGGFSGGAHVALRLALAYPDLFRGALLNAGSDPIGGGTRPLPPRDLFRMFQDRSRIVYVTGERDLERLAMDTASRSALQSWCKFDAEFEITPGVGHAPAPPDAFARALRALEMPGTQDRERVEACQKALDASLAAELGRVESLIAEAKPEEAQRLLLETDRKFGGLAAPRSLELEAALGWKLP